MWSRKQTCADCHYFVKEFAGTETALPPRPFTLEIGREQRVKAKHGDYSWVGPSSLCCSRKVWDEGYMSAGRREKEVSQTNRRGKCFFWSFRPGMMLPAAFELQAHETDAKEKSRSRRWTFYLLVVGFVLGLVAKTCWPTS